MNEKIPVNSAVRVIRHDSIPLAKAHYTEEGYLVDTPIVTSVGIFEYKNEDGSIRRELRMPEHVFKPESLQSYKGKPIIVTHDAGLVNKNNVSDEAVGTILSEGFQDGNDVRAEIIIHDANELKRCGLKELSLGYSLDLVEEPGEWNGQPYDAVQTNIIINHLALVANARAGEQARLNIDGKDENSKKGGTEMSTKPKTKAKRKDEDDLAVELAKTVLEEAAQTEAPAAATDEGGAAPAPEQGEGQGGNLNPSEDLLKSIRERKDRRDSEQEEAPTNLDEANEVIRQQNEDIDALLSMLDKKNEENTPAPGAEGENTDSDCEENQDSDTDPAGTEENTDDDDSGEGEKSSAMNADSIDALVRARAAMSRLGEKYNIDGLDDLSMSDAMRKVIAVATPGIRLDSDAELKGAFKVAVATLKSQKTIDDQKAQMYSGVRTDSSEQSQADSARQRMINSRK